jgi:hypothetical protein
MNPDASLYRAQVILSREPVVSRRSCEDAADALGGPGVDGTTAAWACWDSAGTLGAASPRPDSVADGRRGRTTPVTLAGTRGGHIEVLEVMSDLLSGIGEGSPHLVAGARRWQPAKRHL